LPAGANVTDEDFGRTKGADYGGCGSDGQDKRIQDGGGDRVAGFSIALAHAARLLAAPAPH
jgi:hypothetical protein